jgi:exodeoxyribonuclease VIII
MDETEYNAIDAIRFSRLKRMAVSALEYHANPRRDSSAMGLGRAAHCRILTPDRYAQTVAAKPDGMSFATKEGKAWRAEHEGREILGHAESLVVETMAYAVTRCSVAVELLDDAAEIETPHIWPDAGTGLLCKCKPDLYTHCGALVDLKTAADVSPRGFAWQCASLYYHAQMAFYMRGAAAAGKRAADHAYLIAVQSAPPFDCCVYRLGLTELTAGEALCRKWLAAVKSCADAKRWPGVDGGHGVVDLVLPDWALGDDVDELDWGKESVAA